VISRGYSLLISGTLTTERDDGWFSSSLTKTIDNAADAFDIAVEAAIDDSNEKFSGKTTHQKELDNEFFDQSMKNLKGTNNALDALTKAKTLYDKKVITKKEFDKIKKELL